MVSLALLAVLSGVEPPIVITAPPDVARELKSQLEARKRTVIDASAIDRGLFGESPDAFSALKQGAFDEELPKLPDDVTADVKRGIAGCKKSREPECGERLVEVVWQRWL